MSTLVLNHLDVHDESSHEMPCLSDDFEEPINNFKLNDEWKKHSLEKCLNMPSLKSLLDGFGKDNIAYYCEMFGVIDVNVVRDYEKNPKNFFSKLLLDYAVKDNKNSIKSLVDLQEKLWSLKNGKLLCKNINNKQNDLLKEINENNQQKLVIGINVYPYNEITTAKQENADILVINSNQYQNYTGDIIKSSSSTSSVLTDSSGDNTLRNKSFPKHKKLKVSLFYHENQDSNRISQFIKKFESVIDFDDLTKKSEQDLEVELEKDNYIFILFDKQTDELIDATRETKKNEHCRCHIKTECKCSFYKKFYELIYKMYLDRKNKKYYTFLMDDFDNFKNEKQNFKYKWLLREKQQNDTDSQNNNSQQSSICSEKKVYVKPYQIPEHNNEFNKRLTRFINNLIYYPYHR